MEASLFTIWIIPIRLPPCFETIYRKEIFLITTFLFFYLFHQKNHNQSNHPNIPQSNHKNQAFDSWRKKVIPIWNPPPKIVIVL
mmetsp:Transcript_4034/g.5911  ORF Transcript_4034/g.5911 Transcript_4034/m.5911 type:complete len:84 (-) Transcript_4034:276-527(-)